MKRDAGHVEVFAGTEQPLNGVIVTLSVTDLMLWSKKERYYFAGHLRMRLAELPVFTGNCREEDLVDPALELQ